MKMFLQVLVSAVIFYWTLVVLLNIAIMGEELMGVTL